MSNGTKLALFIVALLIIVYGFFAFDLPYKKTVDDFATCAAAGYPVAEMFPRQCTDAKGTVYTEEVGSATSTEDKIFIESPRTGGVVSSPVKISGQARGTWFFEASFPIEIVSADGRVLGRSSAQAKGEWMTSAFVPWTSTVRFDVASGTVGALPTHGFIRLKKDNPSGDPARDERLDVPVEFSTSTALNKSR